METKSERQAKTEGTADTPARKWMKQTLRITAVFGLVLFVLPAFVVLKYSLIDRPAERKIADSIFKNCGSYANSECVNRRISPDLSDASATEYSIGAARVGLPSGTREAAVYRMVSIVSDSGNQWKRPMDCVLIKSELSQLQHDSDPEIRKAVVDTLYDLARHGAQLQR